MRQLDHSMNIPLHIFPVPAEHLADIHDHVQLFRAVVERPAGFRSLDGGGVAAMGETDRGASLHRAAAQNFRAPVEVVGHDADAPALIFEPQPAALLELLVRQRGIQQRMINHLGDFVVGIIHNVLHWRAL